MPASPAADVDTVTGEGVADALVGADTVIDISNAPVWDDGAVISPTRFEAWFATHRHGAVR